MFLELSFSSDSLGMNSSFYSDSLCIYWSEYSLIKCLKAKTNVITTERKIPLRANENSK